MAKHKVLAREDLENFGSIITIKGTNHCLGDLLFMDSIPDDKGVMHHNMCFCPNNGAVPVTKEEAEAHNKALDKARIEGLDRQCKIGQGGDFYFTEGAVRTWSGTAVEGELYRKGRKIVLVRGDRVFTGSLDPSKAGDFFFLKRVA